MNASANTNAMPFFGPAKTSNHLVPEASNAWRKTFETACAEDRATLQRAQIIDNDRLGIVGRSFGLHVAQLHHAALSPVAVGAGLGAVGGGVWGASKWDGTAPSDLVQKVLLGAGLGAVGGGVVGAMYERTTGPRAPHVARDLPLDVRHQLVLLASGEVARWIPFGDTPAAEAIPEVLQAGLFPAWRVAAWEASWTALVEQYAPQAGPPLTIHPLALLPRSMRGLVR
jgi:hypothetical protein